MDSERTTSCVLPDTSASDHHGPNRARRDGEVVVRLPQKARAMDEAVKLLSTGELKHCDVAVFWNICSGMDNQTGQCVRKYATIASACGMSRSSVGASLKRLREAGLIQKQPRFGMYSGQQIASAFELGDTVLAPPNRSSTTGLAGPEQGEGNARRGGTVPLSTVLRGGTLPPLKPLFVQNAGHPRPAGWTPNGSRLSCFPNGRPGQQTIDDVDWDDILMWLIEQGQYLRQWRFGADALAKEDLERWRREKGDRRLLSAIERTKQHRLYGASLIDFLENTYGHG